MSKKPHWLGIFGLPLSLVLVVAALYLRKPAVRDFIDEKCPWVKSSIGRYAPPFEVRVVPASSPPVKVAQTQHFDPSPVPTPVAVDRNAEAREVVAPRSTSIPAEKLFDLKQVCDDPSRWPKTVLLKRSVDFPAVLNGKANGTLRAPVGSEARVVVIQAGKLGVEYRGGGAWLDIGATDFVERARLALH